MTKKLALALSLTASATLLTTAAISQPILEGGKKFTTSLTSAAEVPGPGDPNASGTATIVINPGQQRVCWEITTSGIGAAFTISGAHIHSAFPGSAGPIVLPLTAVKNGTSTGCADASRSLIDAIRKAPQGFYVNVHYTPTFAAGAIRGQLG